MLQKSQLSPTPMVAHYINKGSLHPQLCMPFSFLDHRFQKDGNKLPGTLAPQVLVSKWADSSENCSVSTPGMGLRVLLEFWTQILR